LAVVLSLPLIFLTVMTALALLNERHNRWKETHFHSFKIELALQFGLLLGWLSQIETQPFLSVGIMEAHVLGVLNCDRK